MRRALLVICVGCSLVTSTFVTTVIVSADDKKPEASKQVMPTCPEQLKLTQGLARENDRHRDNAVREKVSYQLAYESERARRVMLEKEVADLKAKLTPDAAAEKKPE